MLRLGTWLAPDEVRHRLNQLGGAYERRKGSLHFFTCPESPALNQLIVDLVRQCIGPALALRRIARRSDLNAEECRSLRDRITAALRALDEEHILTDAKGE